MTRKPILEELVVISGKGGTGKTSLTAAFAALIDNAVLADCDVDAADLHLILKPTILKQGDFTSGHEAIIRQDDCVQCGACLAACRFDAVDMNGKGAGDATSEGSEAANIPLDCGDITPSTASLGAHMSSDMLASRSYRPTPWHSHPNGILTTSGPFTIDPLSCEGCGACVYACPVDAIDFPEQVCGEWYVSGTDHGLMAHAKLGVSGENSGRLVSLVRQKARELAEKNAISTILIDGPPGIGCPVIASITGATKVLIVTEPTCSGEHDLKRVLELAHYFGIPTSVCVNKWDINPEITERIEAYAKSSGATVVGRVRYAKEVTAAQLEAKSVIEYDSPVADDVRNVWKNFDRMTE